MRLSTLSLVVGVLLLAACGEAVQPTTAKLPPFVKSVELQAADDGALGLSGTVRAQVESPLAFQVGGRISARRVDAGQQVAVGQPLFELDTRDLEQSVVAAAADLAAADTALASATADLVRGRQLLAQQFTSAQALERLALAQREAQTRRDAAAARSAQARNALDYGRLRAPANGVLIEVSGEQGQVVPAGQPVAVLAQAGEREIEVHFPDAITPPERGEVMLADDVVVPLQLRETAAALDPQGRTRRARYTVLAQADALVLGAVVRTRFGASTADRRAAALDFKVPIGALNERGEGAQVWRVSAGTVQPVAVEVLSIDGETARIRGPLTAGERVVALGTHLLTDNMQVRELDQ